MKKVLNLGTSVVLAVMVISMMHGRALANVQYDDNVIKKDKETVAPVGAYDVALVVTERVSGVTIIRNVKPEQLTVLPLPAEDFIGSSDFLKPLLFLSEEQLEYCERRLKKVKTIGRRSIKLDGARYCQ